MVISAQEEEVDSAADPDKEGIEVVSGHCIEPALWRKIGTVVVVGVKMPEGRQRRALSMTGRR